MADLKIQLETPLNDDRPVFLAGNFNNWRVNESEYQMTKVTDNKYSFTFLESSSLPEPLEYKYIRGGWENVELDHYGNRTPNRRIYPSQNQVFDFVPRWASNGLSYPQRFLPKVVVLDEDFEIPQLIRTRRIAALLPHDYYESDKRYPVLYLQDGQNLFGQGAGYGTWGVPKKMAVLSERGRGDVIIIAIDHAEEERIDEFTPSQPTKLGIGDGKKYVRFLADTLKPYVDKTFRTKPDPSNTGIGGSSMGGLISLYAGKMYPEVYSKWLIFSPSLWVSPNLKFEKETFYQNFERRIFLYAGARESYKLVDQLLSLEKRLQKLQSLQESDTYIKVQINPEGEHKEYYWGTAFPIALEWLFYQKSE